MKCILKAIGKVLSVILLVFATVVLASEFSPIYDFQQPAPFSGPDIYNPYESLDTAISWKRANFHTHTKVDHILNECPEYPDVVYADYRKLGYDILTFSNHNQLTEYPDSATIRADVYEHGVNLFKFHKLVFGPKRMLLWDPLLPLLVSQKQWQYDYLSGNADFIVMNHPDRTHHTTTESMRLLSGYRFMEADSGISTELIHWDEALSAGHYSFCLADDDCHGSKDSYRIGVRCNWLNTTAQSWEDVRKTLLEGNFYSMRVPDFGYGDWNVKYAENAKLPKITDAGLFLGAIAFVEVSEPAELIEAIGQNHTVLGSVCNSTSIGYNLDENEPYVRFVAHFKNGVVIYTNPFARYDKTIAESPWKATPHSVNYPLTILFNLLLLVAIAGLVTLLVRLLRPHKK